MTKDRMPSFFILLCIVVLFVAACSGKECLPDNSQAASPAPYPPSKLVEMVEEINGYSVSDPYRWMEEENAAEEWITAQNEYTEQYLSRHQFPGLQERTTEFFDIGYISSPGLAGGRLFFTKRDDKDLEQGQLMVKIADEEKVLVDPNQLDPEGKTSIDWYYPSIDGRLLAYGLSKDGTENSTLYVMEVDSGKVLADRIPQTRFCSLAWLPDGSGFYYTRYPDGDRYNRKAWFHKLGSPVAEDTLIFGEKADKSDWTALDLSPDGKQLLVVEFRGHTIASFYLYRPEEKKLSTLFVDLNFSVIDLFTANEGIYVANSLNAPNGRISLIDPKQPEPENWRTILEEDEWPIERMLFSRDRLLVQKLENVSSKLYVHDLEGKRLGQIEQETLGMVGSSDLEYETGQLAFIQTSFFLPTTLYMTDTTGSDFTAKKTLTVAADINPEAYEIKQVRYPSYDGAMVNMFIVHKKNLPMDGLTPALLYGYGGFQINMAPYFSRRVMTWIDRGGVYAVANIRGGGEFGEKWHEAGVREKKHQVFRDFEFAMRYLIGQKYTSADKLVIEGGSNGGLLVGAMMVQVPHLFACGVASVGLYDMIRYHRFPPGELWVSEYGNADKKEDTGFLLGYSPYHQVVDGISYPAFLGDTAESDTRVHWMHSAKFVARLQAADKNGGPILFDLERRAGHGAGKGKSDITKEYVNKFIFMLSIVGDPAAR